MADNKSVEKKDVISKKRKNEIDLNTGKEKVDSKRIKFENLSDFEFVKVLSEDSKSKTLMLHLQRMPQHEYSHFNEIYQPLWVV